MALFGRGDSPFTSAWFRQASRKRRGFCSVTKQIQWANLNYSDQYFKVDFFFPWSGQANFRATAAYVADGSREFYVLGNADTYPVERRNQTMGWDGVALDMGRDRNNTLDRHLAGMNQVTNDGTQSVWRWNLPQAGVYTVRLALGDGGSDQGYQYVKISDDTTSRIVIDDTDGTTAANFDDATGVSRSAAAWAGSNVAVTGVSFSTGILKLTLGSPTAQANSSTIATLYLELEPGVTEQGAATIAAISAVSGTVTATVPVAATIAAQSAVSGPVASTVPVAGSIAVQSAVSAPLLGALPVTSAIAASSTLTSDLRGAAGAASTISAGASFSGTALSTVPVASNIAAQSAVSSPLLGALPVSSTIAAQSATSGTALSTAPVASAVAAQSAVSGTVGVSHSGSIAVNATLSVQSTTSGTALSTVPGVSTIAVNSGVTGTASASVPAQAALSVSAVCTGGAIAARAARGTCSSVSTLTGGASGVVPLGASIAPSSTSQGALRRSFPVSGGVSGVSAVSAPIRVDRGVVGLSSGVAVIGGSVVVARGVSAGVAASSELQSNGGLTRGGASNVDAVSGVEASATILLSTTFAEKIALAPGRTYLIKSKRDIAPQISATVGSTEKSATTQESIQVRPTKSLIQKA